MDEKALKKELKNSFKGNKQSIFLQNKGSKWSAALNLAHLTLSAKIFRRALTLPKWALALRFGLNLEKQQDLNWIRQTYQKASFPAIMSFEPRMSSDTSMEYEKEQFITEHKAILESPDSWSELAVKPI
ncbi:MAG: putative damage-inducible protein DinB [Arcticibacterium sp.]|jgi:uncharacterized damage-inducible protein DinB